MIAVNAADTTGVLKSARDAASRRTHRLHESEGGFTMVELLMVMLLLGVVLGATLGILTNARGFVGGDIQASHTVEDAQTGLNRMVRELRQATAITIYNNNSVATSGNQIVADVTLASGTVRVIYQCDLTSGTLKVCLRRQTATNVAPTFVTSTAGQRVVIEHVQNTTQFSSPSSKYYQLIIQVKSIGQMKSTAAGHSITLTDGFYARNT
jgi:prepilin-type N-terminal cleavage/methylation domain-containing protein